MGAAFWWVMAGLGLGIAWAQQPGSAIEADVRGRVPVLRQWAADPTIVASVRRANRQARSMGAIREIDRRWQSTSGVDEFMRSILTNAGAERLRALRSRMPEITEAFVTDRLGANVSMTNKTSDFWQGDEDKFKRTVSAGPDGHHIEPVGFDESIQAYAVQICVPVPDGGSVIGVLVATLNLERLERVR